MPCLFVTTFCTYYAACRLGFRCILLPRVYWHSRRASNKPTAYISYPCFPFSPIFPSVYMGLDCSGSDIVDSSAILMEKLMKNTENKRILTCLTMSKIKYIRKEYLSSSGSYLSLIQNILLLYVVCVCVFSVSSTLSLCQIAPQRQIVYLECCGAYVQTHSLFVFLCVDMCWDIKWHS